MSDERVIVPGDRVFVNGPHGRYGTVTTVVRANDGTTWISVVLDGDVSAATLVRGEDVRA